MTHHDRRIRNRRNRRNGIVTTALTNEVDLSRQPRSNDRKRVSVYDLNDLADVQGITRNRCLIRMFPRN